MYSSVTQCYHITGIVLCILHSQDKAVYLIHCTYSTELILVGHLRAAQRSANTASIYSNLTHQQTVASSHTASKHTGTVAFMAVSADMSPVFTLLIAAQCFTR